MELGLYQDDRRLPQTHARTQLRPVREVPRLHLHLHGGTPLPHDEGVLPRPLRQDARLRAPGAVDRRRLLRRGERGERLLVRVDDPRSPLRQRLLRAGIRLPQHRLHAARLLRLRRLDAERTGPCGHRRILHAETHVALGRRHPVQRRLLAGPRRQRRRGGAQRDEIRWTHPRAARPRLGVDRAHRRQHRPTRPSLRLPLLRRRRPGRLAASRRREKRSRIDRQPRQRDRRPPHLVAADVRRPHAGPETKTSGLRGRPAAHRAQRRKHDLAGLHEADEPQERAAGQSRRTGRGRCRRRGNRPLPVREDQSGVGTHPRQPDARHPARHGDPAGLRIFVERRVRGCQPAGLHARKRGEPDGRTHGYAHGRTPPRGLQPRGGRAGRHRRGDAGAAGRYAVGDRPRRRRQHPAVADRIARGQSDRVRLRLPHEADEHGGIRCGAFCRTRTGSGGVEGRRTHARKRLLPRGDRP